MAFTSAVLEESKKAQEELARGNPSGVSLERFKESGGVESLKGLAMGASPLVAYGAGLAGVAGALFGALKTLFPDMGSGYIVEAFLVVVVGGIGLVGSMFSSGILGELSSIFSYFTNETFARFILFTLIVVFLRFRPQGLITDGATRR